MSKSIIKKRNVFFIVMLSVTGLYILFIWWHSTLTADESSVESANVLAFLENILRAVGIDAGLTDHIIRKSAHFCEFALLGFLNLWTAYAKNKKIVKNLMPSGFICLSTALVDELVQIKSKGRSAEVTDIALDFCGAFFGALFFIIVISVIKLFKK